MCSTITLLHPVPITLGLWCNRISISGPYQFFCEMVVFSVVFQIRVNETHLLQNMVNAYHVNVLKKLDELIKPSPRYCKNNSPMCHHVQLKQLQLVILSKFKRLKIQSVFVRKYNLFGIVLERNYVSIKFRFKEAYSQPAIAAQRLLPLLSLQRLK